MTAAPVPDPVPDALVGVDIGGTTTVAVLMAADGTVRARAGGATPAGQGPDAVLDVAAALVGRVDPDARAAGVGVGATGVLDLEGRVVASTTAMTGWRGTDVRLGLARRLSERSGPVAVLNDVHAFVVHEACMGVAAGAGDLLGVTVGTGVGGGHWRRGEVLRGRLGAAGSMGHGPVSAAAGRPCPCGGAGHVEAVSSAPAMLAAYRAAGGAAGSLAEVSASAAAGDRLASDVLSAGGRALGEALAGVVGMVSPDVVVLGGGAARATGFVASVAGALQAHALPLVADVPVVLSAAGDDAVALGAALAVRDRPGGRR